MKVSIFQPILLCAAITIATFTIAQNTQQNPANPQQTNPNQPYNPYNQDNTMPAGNSGFTAPTGTGPDGSTGHLNKPGNYLPNSGPTGLTGPTYIPPRR